MNRSLVLLQQSLHCTSLMSHLITSPKLAPCLLSFWALGGPRIPLVTPVIQSPTMLLFCTCLIATYLFYLNAKLSPTEVRQTWCTIPHVKSHHHRPTFVMQLLCENTHSLRWDIKNSIIFFEFLGKTYKKISEHITAQRKSFRFSLIGVGDWAILKIIAPT